MMTDVQPDTLMRDAAAELARLGCEVFPLQGKVPVTAHGFHDAKAAGAPLEQWWPDGTRRGIGLRLGHMRADGTVEFIVDVDPRNGGALAWARLIAGRELPDTATVATGGGGWHFYFRAPFGWDAWPKTIAEGIDIKGPGGYAVVPPSVHPDTGDAYRFERTFEEAGLAEAPKWLLDVMEASCVRAPGKGAPVVSVDTVFVTGERNNMLASVAGTMRRRGLTGSEILPTLLAVNATRCRPQLPDREVESIARSAERNMDAADPVQGTAEATATLASKILRPEDFAKSMGPVPWVCQRLRLTPGPVTMVAGEPGSGKTYGLQAALLAYATGRPVFGEFPVAKGGGRAIHFDYEQGERLTHSRYREIAAGMGLDWREIANDRLTVAVMPNLYMTGLEDVDAWCRALDGYGMATIDSYRRCCRVENENDPKSAVPLEAFWRVSEKTGCVVSMTHHFNKAGNQERRKLADRVAGSGAIVAMTQDIWGVERASEETSAPSTWHHVRSRFPGAREEGFQLRGTWTPELNGVAALSLVVVPFAEAKSTSRREAYVAKLGRVLEAVRAMPGQSARKLAVLLDESKSAIADDLAELENAGKVRRVPGPRNGSMWFPA